MNKYVELIKKKILGVLPKQEEGQSEEAYRNMLIIRGVEAAVFLFAALAIVKGAMAVLPGSITVSSSVNGRELPIYCVETEKKQISLSFDVAWGNEDVEKILNLLRKHNIFATFFMTGGWVEAYPDDVKAILAAGHDLGNHSENHKNMSQLSEEQCEAEIMETHRKVQELTGYEMFLFRPPYGDYNNIVIKCAAKCKYFSVEGNVDSLDWKDYGVDAIIKEVTQNKNLGNGSIILCHNGTKYTAGALDGLITELEKQGYEFVPISQLIYTDHYHMDVEGRQIKN
ncbi:MAG: polysaccharide deacetylase family protein [Clostridiales bacterium]|nr:polysaccharide deacetylase family protein [Clostridiales bacterium]